MGLHSAGLKALCILTCSLRDVSLAATKTLFLHFTIIYLNKVGTFLPGDSQTQDNDDTHSYRRPYGKNKSETDELVTNSRSRVIEKLTVPSVSKEI